jgi:hypothetical protein
MIPGRRKCRKPVLAAAGMVTARLAYVGIDVESRDGPSEWEVFKL